MAKKVDDTIQEIKGLLKKKSLVLGTERVMKELKKGNLAKVFLTKNTPENVRSDANHYGKLTETEVVNLRYNNEEFGEICKKPFSISVLGLLK